MTNPTSPYTPTRQFTTEQLTLRGDTSYRLYRWAATTETARSAPPLVLAHGWMDIGASFQRCVDRLAPDREIVAFDWRGFGASRGARPVDSYWFYDYYADLDALIDHLSPDAPIDLLGHSMGGNIAMTYAGACPARIRRLINVEGFGLPPTTASQAPARLARWLSQLKAPMSIRSFANAQEVATHLLKGSPRMEPEFAAWLASQWAQPGEDGRWHVRADPVHKRVNPILYRSDEALAAWGSIQAPVLWVEGDQTEVERWRGDRYPREDFEHRLNSVKSLERQTVTNCGHMVHLDQPDALAAAVERFLS